MEKTHARKDLRQEEKGETDNEMVGRHHRLNGYEFEQALGVGEGQGSLVCCSPWVCKETDTTEKVTELQQQSEDQQETQQGRSWRLA